MIKKHLKFGGWVILGVLLFSLSFPGYFNKEGLPIFSFFAMFPLFYSVYKMNYRESVFYGFIYGVGSYLLFNYWLKSFDPVTFSVEPTIIGLYYLLLFVICKYIYRNFYKNSYIPLTLTWFLYEYFKGENFIGFTYGTLAHSMYKTHIFTGIADITGTYIVSILIVFPSIFIAVLLNHGIKQYSRKEVFIPVLIYLFLLLTSSIYTFKNIVDYSNSQTLKISLIQHNINSWAQGSNSFYKRTLDDLIDLSTEELENNPDVIVWAETAFIPAIEWHKKYKQNLFRLNLVKRLETFVGSVKADFVIGANETIGKNEENQIQYNSVYHYIKDSAINKYRKMKLVPFTESFPYPNLFPWLNSYIKSIGGKDITPGDTQINFNIKGISTTPLICYEDTFSSIARVGIKNGGDLLLNLTNDAWSKDEPCSLQHLSASVFRSIENRRSFARVGTGGFTCIIDANGKILSSIPILTKASLTYETPIYNNKITFYTKFGNIFDKILLLIITVMFTYKFTKSILFLLHSKKKLNLDLV